MRIFECFVYLNPIRIFCREQYINKIGEKLIGNSRCKIVIFRNFIAFVSWRYNYIITIVYLSISLGISSGMELPSGENGIMMSPLANSNPSQKAALTPFDFWLITLYPLERRYSFEPSSEPPSRINISPHQLLSIRGIITFNASASREQGLLDEASYRNRPKEGRPGFLAHDWFSLYSSPWIPAVYSQFQPGCRADKRSVIRQIG